MYRVMIVDDEPTIRNGLVNFIEWTSLDCEVVYEACDGIEARDLLNISSPDIIIADIKMPGLNGLELAQYIYENYSCIKIILLTGYSDFKYAQSAIKYGVVDFVLKPATTENILDAVNRAKALLIQEKEKCEKLLSLEFKIDDNLIEMRDKFFQNILNGILVNPKSIETKMEELSISLEEFIILSIEISNFEDLNTKNTPEGYSRFITSIKNFLSLTLKDYKHHIVLISGELLCVIINHSSSDQSDHTQNILTLCNDILSTVNNFMNFSVSIGISNMHKGILEVTSAYDEAMKCLSNKFYAGSNNVFAYSNYSINQQPSEINATNKSIDSIIECIQSGNHSYAINIVTDLFLNQKTLKQPIGHIKATSIHICSKLLSNYSLNLLDISKTEYNVYTQIFESKSIDNLIKILSSVIEDMSTYLSYSGSQVNYIVDKSLEYIKKYYTQDINLKGIAEFVHVNSSYLSRLFHKETGETVTEVITRFRIEKAKELLISSNIKASEAAYAVGINDPAYFSQIFKKYTGVSPTDYKYLHS